VAEELASEKRLSGSAAVDACYEDLSLQLGPAPSKKIEAEVPALSSRVLGLERVGPDCMAHFPDALLAPKGNNEDERNAKGIHFWSDGIYCEGML
jgi:hypothetical protein